MKADATISIAGKLGGWISALSADAVPDTVLHGGRRGIIDTIAVAIAGSALPVSGRIRDHVADEYAPGGCMLLGTDGTASTTGAALANGVAAHALDWDDTSYAGVVHGSAVVLPAVLAAVQQADGAGASLLEGFIVGSETVYALGSALTDSHYLSGWWATSTLGAIGAAAGSAKALGLAPEQTTAAIALASIQTNGMLAMLGTDAKPILAGQASKLGLESALLAGQGNGAPVRAFEDRRGFLNLMNDGAWDADAFAKLGRVWRLTDPGVLIKRYPVCSAAQAAVQLTEELISGNALDGDAIARVRCEVPHMVKISLIHDEPVTPAQAQFSMPFAVGSILAFGELGPSQINSETLADPALRNAMRKVEMIEAEDLNGPGYQPRFPECARVTIAAGDGAKHAAFLGAPLGMPENPLGDDGLSEKFHAAACFAGWDGERAESLLSGLWRLDAVTSVNALLRGEA